jgi:Zn-dependent M16 (insulinase) family peptidase
MIELSQLDHLGEANALHSRYSALVERYGGLEQIGFMSELASRGQTLDEVVSKLELIGTLLLAAPNIRCSLTCGEDTISQADRGLHYFLDGATTSATTVGTDSTEAVAGGGSLAEASGSNTFIEMPVAVNFAARAIPTVPYAHPDSPLLSVLASVMSAKFLHREIREKNGAYGGGATHNSGLFKFYSHVTKIFFPLSFCAWLGFGRQGALGALGGPHKCRFSPNCPSFPCACARLFGRFCHSPLL